MKKITILALHLGFGGIEKCISSLANSLIDDYEVEIIVTYKLLNEPAFFVNNQVSIRYLLEDLKPNHSELKRAIKQKRIASLLKESIIAIKVLYYRRKRMIQAIKQSDSEIMISTRDIHNKWLGKFAMKRILKVAWEHNHPNENNRYINKVVKSVKKIDYLVLVNKSIYQFYDKILTEKKCKCVYIPNTIDYVPNQNSPLVDKRLISVGRLSKEKGFSDLINLFSIIHVEFPEWRLEIIGDGDEYQDLIKQIESLCLNDTVKIHGFQNQEYISNYLMQSSIYIMTSHTESFGIVLLDANSFGVPCVAYTTAQGARDIIRDNINGFLIENRNQIEMIKKIKELITQYEKRLKFGKQAKIDVEKYLMSNVILDWKKMFNEHQEEL